MQEFSAMQVQKLLHLLVPGWHSELLLNLHDREPDLILAY